MLQSFQSIPIHLIWSTKHRIPLLLPEIEDELFKYMASIFHNHDSPSLIINGTVDHVHMIASLSRTTTIAKLIEEVKRSSSKWIKSKDKRFENFIGRMVMRFMVLDNIVLKI
jgi:REP-associated tyrosine transposase